MSGFQNPSALLFVVAMIALVPFVAVMTTSFVKLAVVFSLVRNALGVQQIPPNMAIYGLSIILTLYIMSPVGYAIHDVITKNNISFQETEHLSENLDLVSAPLKTFLKKYTTSHERQFFVDSAKSLWPQDQADKLNEDSLLVIMPAFTVSELTTAFQIGFLLYLPFLVIDLIVSNILLALGMMMMSPMTISLPFKLLLFVIVDGWARLIHGLVLTYQ